MAKGPVVEAKLKKDVLELLAVGTSMRPELVAARWASDGRLLSAVALARCLGFPVPQPLPATPFFGDLGPQPFVTLANAVELRVVAAGASIVTEGEPGTSLFGIAHGRVSVVREYEAGARKAVAQLGEGGLFGEIGLVAGTPRLATVVADSPMVLLELSRAAFDRVCALHAHVAAVMQSFFNAQLLRNVLQSNPLFARLTQAQREETTRAFTLRTASPGDVLLRQGELGDGLYLVLRGRCVPFRSGGQAKLAEMVEGDVFGELSLLLGKPVAASVRAETACTLLWLSRAAFEKLAKSLPAVRAELTKLGFERLQSAAKLLSGRISHPGDSRV